MRVVDHAWNEVSGRYVELTALWEGPQEWRGPPAKGHSKQGSTTGALCDAAQQQAQEQYDMACETAMRHYKGLLHLGVCKEQARAVLPLSFMTEWYWTLSLEAAFHFCKLRSAADAQAEIRELAAPIHAILEEKFPYAYTALTAAES